MSPFAGGTYDGSTGSARESFPRSYYGLYCHDDYYDNDNVYVSIQNPPPGRVFQQLQSQYLS